MNYGKPFSSSPFIAFSFLFSRAGVPEKYCIDIERKINGPMGIESTANTSTVQ